eukprot:5772445-Amphidinium_carterae.1
MRSASLLQPGTQRLNRAPQPQHEALQRFALLVAVLDVLEAERLAQLQEENQQRTAEWDAFREKGEQVCCGQTVQSKEYSEVARLQSELRDLAAARASEAGSTNS